jgi:hypothetical protein
MNDIGESTVKSGIRRARLPQKPRKEACFSRQYN